MTTNDHSLATDSWTLDLFVDGEHQAEQAFDPQPAAKLDEAMQTAQNLESELW